MAEENITYTYIGRLHTPFTSIKDMPIQPSGALGTRGELIVDPKYVQGLQDLEGFSHIYVIFHFHRSSGYQLLVSPFLDTTPRGIFATRAPRRPNPIGLSIVRLVSTEKNILTLENVDMLDGTPVLDIKPYVPVFDQRQDVRIGWLEDKKGQVKAIRTDDRFKS